MNSIRFCFGVFICVFIFTLIATPNSANAKKIELFGSAVEITTCNSGSLASYYVSKGTSDKLFFYFLGGGADVDHAATHLTVDNPSARAGGGVVWSPPRRLWCLLVCSV